MKEPAKWSPHRDLDDVYRARPLLLVAAIIIAGHQIRGTNPPVRSGPGTFQEEVARHE